MKLGEQCGDKPKAWRTLCPETGNATRILFRPLISNRIEPAARENNSYWFSKHELTLVNTYANDS